MQSQNSGMYFANMLARIVLQSLETSIGKDKMPDLLQQADLAVYIDNYPPQDLEKNFDVARLTALRLALNVLYGERGGQALALRAGRLMAPEIMKYFVRLPDNWREGWAGMTLPVRLERAISTLTATFADFSDQDFTFAEAGDHFAFTMDRCAFCAGQKSRTRLCHIQKGLLQEWIRQVMLMQIAGFSPADGAFRVEIASCTARDGGSGRLTIYKLPVD